MPTGDEHKWTIRATDLAFLLLVCTLLPFDVVLQYHEGRCFIAATKILMTEPDCKCEQSYSNQNHYYFSSNIPTINPVLAL